MSSIIEFKHTYGDAVVDMSSVNQITMAKQNEPSMLIIENSVYSFSNRDAMSKVFKDVTTYMKGK